MLSAPCWGCWALASSTTRELKILAIEVKSKNAPIIHNNTFNDKLLKIIYISRVLLKIIFKILSFIKQNTLIFVSLELLS